MKRSTAALLGLLLANCALAQPADGVSLRGLQLGKGIPDARECRYDLAGDRKFYRHTSASDEPMCWMDEQENEVLVRVTNTKRLTLSGAPFIKGAGRNVEVALMNEAIAAVGFRFLSVYAEDFRAALVDKFGKPTSSELVTYTNRFGARTTGYRLLWAFPDSTISADQFDGRTDWGVVWARSKAYDAAMAETSNETRKAIGGRL